MSEKKSLFRNNPPRKLTPDEFLEELKSYKTPRELVDKFLIECEKIANETLKDAGHSFFAGLENKLEPRTPEWYSATTLQNLHWVRCAINSNDIYTAMHWMGQLVQGNRDLFISENLEKPYLQNLQRSDHAKKLNKKNQDTWANYLKLYKKLRGEGKKVGQAQQWMMKHIKNDTGTKPSLTSLKNHGLKG